MWLLIITTAFWTHDVSDHLNHTVYQFQEFKTKKRCEQIKEWIIKREGVRIEQKKTTVQCVFND